MDAALARPGHDLARVGLDHDDPSVGQDVGPLRVPQAGRQRLDRLAHPPPPAVDLDRRGRRGRSPRPRTNDLQSIPGTLTPSPRARDTADRGPCASPPHGDRGGMSMRVSPRRATASIAAATLIATLALPAMAQDASPAPAGSPAACRRRELADQRAAQGRQHVHAQAEHPGQARQNSDDDPRTTCRSSTCSRTARTASRSSRRSIGAGFERSIPEAQAIMPQLSGTPIAPASALQDVNQQIAADPGALGGRAQSTACRSSRPAPTPSRTSRTRSWPTASRSSPSASSRTATS